MLRHLLGKNENRISIEEFVLDQMKDGVYCLQILPKWELIYANKAMNNMLGYDLHVMFSTPDSLKKIMHPDDMERIKRWYNGELDMTEPFVARFQDSLGYTVWLEDFAKAECDEENNTVRMVGTIRNVTDRMQKEEIRRYLNHRDSQTGLRNRNRYEKRIKELNSKVDYPIGLILLDMDNLKYINDSMGHKMGDELIHQVGLFIAQRLDENMKAYRIGGDEFIILMEETSGKNVKRIYDRLRTELDEYNQDLPLKMELSIGMAFSQHSRGQMIQLFQIADERMYEDKTIRRMKRIGEE